MKTRRLHLPEIAATASFVLLVAASLTGFSSWFAAALLAGIILPVALFRRLFPEAGLFALALANLLSVYACLYVYFVEANFIPVTPWAEATAFLLPIITFVAACLAKQQHIRHLAERRPRLRRQDLIGMVWLLPIVAIGILTYGLPALISGKLARRRAPVVDGPHIGIGVAARRADRSVSARNRRVVRNLFRQSRPHGGAGIRLLQRLFAADHRLAALFSLIDRILPGAQFSISGVARPITFAESLYFSVSTMATIGYGDILPIDDSVRMLAAIEVITGILLLLFGFAEFCAPTGAAVNRDWCAL